MKNVAVVFGGKSGEHEVSLVSAYNVISALDRSRYSLRFIGIDKEGQWHEYKGSAEKIPDGSWMGDKASLAPFSPFGAEAESVDCYFPVLHGTYGEDGTIQGLFEMAGAAYVGCGVLASSLCMDKGIARMAMRDLGIPVAGDILLSRSEILEDCGRAAEKAEKALGYPIFAKPANMGSSVGISKAKDRPSLESALLEASLYDAKVVCEEFIDGAEVESAVLGNENPFFCGIGQIIPCNEFYDYEAKYLTGDKSVALIPAPIGEKAAKEIEEYALRAFRGMGLSGLSRLDFFVAKDGRVILNEINTM
ncbi:MAG: D-alanine--D-alanine ligase, partial [Eubacteriaceae bacterium]|nr:D-alanine--D-alanine ligase [Eubacteriaceae bacterium]